MDLINELEKDLALAFLVEKKHRQKIDSKDVLAFIGRVKASLYRVASPDVKLSAVLEIDQVPHHLSH